RCLAGRTQCLQGPVARRLILFQPEEQRSRPRRAGDRSGDGRQRAVMRALPGEASIEDHDLVASTPPLAHQPGTGWELRAKACGGCPCLLQLHCDLPQLTLRFRAQPAKRQFLQAVGDSSHQQVAAETRAGIGFVETAPFLAKLVETEHREARERLPAGIPTPGRQCRHRSVVSTRTSRYAGRSLWSLLRVTSRPAWRKPVIAARTVCGSQPRRCPISATEAPSARSSMPISSARLVLVGGRSAPAAFCAPARLGLAMGCEAARP